MKTQKTVLPIYIAVDVSHSAASTLMTAVEVLASISNTLKENKHTGDIARICVMEFGSSAKVVVPLSSPQADWPPLAPEGGTSCYGCLFRLLKEEISIGIATLQADGYSVHRPGVFLVGDGQPTDEFWCDDWRQLAEFDQFIGVGFEWHPIIVPIAVGDADEQILRRLAHPPGVGKLVEANSEDGVKSVISSITHHLIGDVLESRSVLGPSVEDDSDSDWL